MKLIKIISLFILLTLAISCSHKIVVLLPKGNVNKPINTEKDDIAPVQKPVNEFKNCEVCNKEFKSPDQGDNDGIQTSNALVKQMINGKITKRALEYLTQNVESATFTSDTSGFVAISHPPDKNYAAKIELPMEGNVGGTDIFEFTKVNGKYNFKNLGEAINSEFWDSHPFAIKDSNCNTLLVWSSDRFDKTKKNSSYPYANKGNADLYYAFNSNGKWSAVKSFSSVSDSINSNNWNEFSPFITCLCKAPLMIFASNRGGKNYNLYQVRLSIDFENQMISSGTAIVKLNKDINSAANQLFPFIPNPISNDSYIYFSSDRVKLPYNKGKDTIIKNVGLYDIYKFPFDVDCKKRAIPPPPPKTEYKVKYNVVIKSTDKNYIPEEPLFITAEINGVKRELKNGDTIDFPIFTKVKTYGGSLYENNSTSNVSILNYYQYRNITKLPPVIKSRELVQTYDTIVNPKYKNVLDTIDVSANLLNAELTKLKNNPLYTRKSMIFVDPGFKIIGIKKVLYKQDTISKKRILTVYDTVQSYDTTYNRITRVDAAGSVLTNRGFSIKSPPLQDTVIYDTIYIIPRMYKCPQCVWVYNEFNKVEKKNVPFFQTGMWEVNTSDNLKRHLTELVSKEYAGASFIELQPENQNFGYRDPSYDEAQVAGRKLKRERRIEEYKVFADSVDRNLARMANGITKKILPDFKELLPKAPKNKLIIQVHGYSDIRPIVRGWYTGDKTVNYYSLQYNDSLKKITTAKSYKVEIRPRSSMVGKQNDTLSKLRAYSGYMEIKKLLMKDKLFKEFVDQGEVYFPDENTKEEELANIMDKAKIIFVIEGKQVDPSLIPEINDYKDRKNDLYILDAIRRVDIIINRIEYKDGKIEAACCGEEK